MIRLEEKHKQAIEFRKRGFTYSEIAKIVDVSKSTVSVWLSKKTFSKEVKKDNQLRAAKENKKRIGLINKARTAERKRTYADAVRGAETEYKHYKNDPLFFAALATYVCCGDFEDGSRIRVSSPSVTTHRLMVRFFVEHLGAEKSSIHCWLMLPDQKSEQKALQFWSKKIGLSVAQFYRSQFAKQAHSTKRLQHGTGNTIIGNTVLKKRLLRWVELYQKEL
jgi:predicted transcriptional regulator